MSANPEIPPLEISYHDEPEVLHQAAAEDYSLHAVPLSWRSSRGSLSMAWFALMSAMFFVVVGSTIALAVGTVNALVGIGLSVIVYGIINNVAAQYAARSGTSVALFSRVLFGQIGATFAALLFGVTITYYAVAEGSIVAIALHTYFGGPGLKIWYLIVVCYSVPLVFRGVRTWLDKVNAVLLPLYVLGMITAVIWAIVKYGYSSHWLRFDPIGGTSVAGAPGWFYAFTVYMGVWVVVMMTWDYARFGRPQDAKVNGRTTFGIPFYAIALLVNGAVGIFIAHTIPIHGPLSESSAIVGIVTLMGPFGALLVWASQTRINTANFYLSSANYQNFFARAFGLTLPRTFWTVVVGVLVYLAMLTNVLSFLLKALSYQGVVIVAWVVIALTHIIWSQRRGQAPGAVEFRPGRVPLVNPGGLVAWVSASIIGIVLLATTGDWGSVWASPITFGVALVIYVASLELPKLDRFSLARPHDPRDEVDDYWEARVRCHDCGHSYIAYEMDRDPSSGHAPICLACASDHKVFLRAARAEAGTPLAPLPAVEPEPAEEVAPAGVVATARSRGGGG